MTEFKRTTESYQAGARTLAGSYYTAESVLADEQERLFANAWVCVGREGDVAAGGDYLIATVANESIIVVRDRTQGVYFVRYIDPAFAGKDEPNIFSKLFSFGKKDDAGGPTRYRVAVKGDGERSSTVTVLNGKGEPENGETGKRITTLLLEDLK